MTPLQSNNVTLLGFMHDDFTFSHETNGENFFTFKLEVERMSGTKDYLPIMISERMIDKKQEYIGNPVCVIGEFRSYNKKTEHGANLLLHVFAMDFYITEETTPINEACFVGYLCKKPLYRKTPLGRQISDLMLAIPRKYGKSDYIPCICWGRSAVYASQMDVGVQVQITGRIQSREYQKNHGDTIENRTAFEVSVIQIDEV